MAEKEQEAVNLPKNTKAALCYVGGWITGLIFLLLEKKDQSIKFHAMQSIVAFGALNILGFTPLAPLAWIGTFILWLVCIIKAYRGEDFELPLAGQFAKKQLEKMK